MAGAFAFAAQTLVARGYYAVKDTLFPAVYGTLAVGLSIPLYGLGLHLAGIRGIAAAVSFSAMLQVSVLYVLWSRKTGNRNAPVVYRAFARQVLLAVPLGLLAWAARAALFGASGPSDVFDGIFRAVATGALFAGALAFVGYRLGIGEIVETFDRIRDRLARGR
jgi:putative peptidoglycan lipid II flippase